MEWFPRSSNQDAKSKDCRVRLSNFCSEMYFRPSTICIQYTIRPAQQRQIYTQLSKATENI